MYYRKAELQNLEIYNSLKDYELKSSNVVPKRIIGFNKAKSSHASKDTFIHFYLDDYQFERIWNAPDRYLDLFSKYGGIIGPDFSMYLNMPEEMKRWNDFRNKLLMKYYQSNGIEVIPNVSWSDYNSFNYCFNGLPKGGVIAVSNLGCLKKPISRIYYSLGLNKANDLLKPSTIIVYGQYSKKIQHLNKIIYFDSYTKSMRGSV